MRTLTLKYGGECRKCGAELEAGQEAGYERRVGVFCPRCTPTDPEEIRKYRQDGADRKAARLEEWAEKRRQKAAALEKRNDPYRGDWAFITQPGYIPERARANRRSERACEHWNKAAGMEARADGLRRGVRVAGDAERIREARRETVRAWIQVGMTVQDAIFGLVEVVRVNRKTARIRCDSGNTFLTELSFLRRVEP